MNPGAQSRHILLRPTGLLYIISSADHVRRIVRETIINKKAVDGLMADEGDPGAFMDRSLLELDPFSVLAGMKESGVAKPGGNE